MDTNGRTPLLFRKTTRPLLTKDFDLRVINKNGFFKKNVYSVFFNLYGSIEHSVIFMQLVYMFMFTSIVVIMVNSF